MKLCVISHAFVESAFLPALDALAARPGVELTLITPERYAPGAVTTSGRFDGAGLSFRSYPLPIRLGSRQGSFFYQNDGLQRTLDEIQPDILLHEQEVFAIGGGQVARMARQRRIQLVMQVWENVDRRLALPRRLLRSYVMERCTGLIAGNVRCGELHRQWGFDGPIEIIQSIGVSRLNPAPVFGRRGRELLKVCYVGRLIPSKGVDLLIRAVAELRGLGVVAQCAIAGRGPERESLEALASQLGVSERVSFLGVCPPEEVGDLMRTSDVLVLPSRRTPVWEEQFGRVLVEAMGEGTVTIGSRTGAIPEVLASDDLLFAEEDVAGLTSVLRRLAEDDRFLESEQRRLWERARTTYTNEVLAERKVAFFRRLLESRS